MCNWAYWLAFTETGFNVVMTGTLVLGMFIGWTFRRLWR